VLPPPPPRDERPLARLRDDRLLLRLLLARFDELLRRPPERLADDLLDALRLDALRLDDFRLDDFRRAPPRDEAERDDDPPRFRADFRPRFAPPDLRDDPPLPDFLRDPRLVAAIQVSPDGRSWLRCVARNGRDNNE
jgi:hypothetical protein